MRRHKKLSARIRSMALSVAMVATMMPATVFAAEGDVPLGASSLGASSIGTVQSFDKLEDRFEPSTGEGASRDVYALNVEPNTPFEDLNLPGELTGVVARTTTVSAPAEDEPVVDSGKPSEPAVDETIPDEDEVVDEDTDDTVSGNQPASPSDAQEEVKEEIKDEDIPLAPERSQDEETTVTTTEQETISVTWNSDKEYKSDENGKFIYTAVLPEGYILADGVKLPQIYVFVGRQARDARVNAITVTINGSTTASGATLQVVVEANGGAEAVTSLKITAGTVTATDWRYLNQLIAMTSFEIDSGIETENVANIPNVQMGTSLFPKSITSVTVPQAITIGECAFFACLSLASADFPAATSIGSHAFAYCANLMTANFHAVTSIGAGAFVADYILTIESFPAATSIGTGAFRECTALSTVSFPKVTSIGDGAFASCTTLATLNLPAAPPTVGTDAFKDCPAARALGYVAADGTALTGEALTAAQAAYKAIDDGNTTDNLWYGWMIEVPKLTFTAKIDGTETALSGDSLQAALNGKDLTKVTELKITAGKVTTADWNYLNSLTALTTFEIDSAVTTVVNIPNGTYEAPIFPPSIVTVTMPQAITIGDYAFRGCAALTNASFPAATSIGNQAFRDCDKLTTASFPKVTTIGDYGFFFCLELTNVSFPEATTISDRMFAGCYKLANVSFPKATKIDIYAFLDCTALTSVSFPAMTDIGNNAFKDCTKLATLKLGATPPTTVATDAFLNCPATRALGYVAADGTALTGDALKAAQAAYKAKDDGNTSDNLWYGWTAGEAVTNAITVSVNGDAAASGATLQAVVEANGGATDVTELKITAGKVTEADWNYLKSLTALTTFEIDSAVTEVANIPHGRVDVSIFPPSIVTITVPQAITIGNYAFSGCTALTTANFPAVTRIEVCTFLNCTALTSVSFPAVTFINLSAFSGCTALTTASFPKVKKGIELSAFKDCTKLATLKLGATPPGVGTNPQGGNSFTNCPATRALGYLAADGTALTGDALTTAQAAYKAIDDGDTTDDLWYGWTITPPAITVTIDGATPVGGTTLQAVVEANGGATDVTSLNITAGKVTTADWNYLKSLTALTTFEIDGAVTEVANIPAASDGSLFPTSIISVTVPQAIAIGRSAFYGCTALESVSFPAATSINDEAFYNCKYLKSADFPTVTSIGKSVFSDCYALATLKLGATPPTVGTDAFAYCPATRALGYLKADGTALTGDALKAAQANYKAIDDGDATDGLWYGWTIVSAVTTHTITASAGTGGSISPSGTVTVNEGESKTFTITADSNYKISSVSVDGENLGEISTYTFENVTGDHTISAAFVDASHIHTPVTEWSSSPNKHWHNCVDNDSAALDLADHSFGDWVIDKAATTTEKGSRHRVCTVCAYRATEEIPATGETPTKPAITAGAGSSHEISGGKDLTVTCSGKLEDLTGIYVDGKLVDAGNYTLKSGSTVLTLKASYLDTLSVGTHTLKFQYKDNISAETSFTVAQKSSPTPAPTVKPTEKPGPVTGDTNNTLPWVTLMVTAFSALALLCVWVWKKRGGHNGKHGA